MCPKVELLKHHRDTLAKRPYLRIICGAPDRFQEDWHNEAKSIFQNPMIR